MTIAFDDARAIVAAAKSVRQMWGDFTVADYGWENDHVFMIIALPDSGMRYSTRPICWSTSETGKLTEIYGTLGHDPVPGLVPIGSPPE